jgi:hypothetical protein
MHEKDQYSIAFSFIPKQDLPSQDVVWGNDFDHPVRDRLPPGVNTAFRIVKDFVDPGLEMDAYADEPWLYGPALSCWFGFRVGDKVDEGFEIPERQEEDDVLREGADGGGQSVRDHVGLPENNEKRRKHFLSRKHREEFSFEKDRLYHADFYNPYLDFGNFALKLPGFSIRVIRYIDEKSHTLRYVFKNRATGDVYMSVNLNLLWGEQLQAALKKEEETIEDFAGAEACGQDQPQANGVDSEEVQEESSSAAEPLPQRTEEATGRETHNEANNAPSSNLEAAESPEMREKPDHVREQVQRMSITDLLQQTSTGDRRGGGHGNALDEVD